MQSIFQISFTCKPLPLPHCVGVCDGPYGSLRMAFDPDGALIALGLADAIDTHPHYFEAGYFEHSTNRDDAKAAEIWDSYRYGQNRATLRPFAIRLYGSDFSHKVWAELLKIPCGQVRLYRDLAQAVNCLSARAVGTAVGRNPVSIFVPCHRVVSTQGLGGYRWGLKAKAQILSDEKKIEQTRIKNTTIRSYSSDEHD